MSDLREPPRELELPELFAAADEIGDEKVYKILDIIVAKRQIEHQRRMEQRASEIVKLSDGAA